MEYTNLSNFTITFNPLTHSDERFKKIFEDKYARVIFTGYKLHHLIDGEELNNLKEKSLSIAEEIRKGELELERYQLKIRLREMYINMSSPFRISELSVDNDINDEFVDYLLPYLKGKKEFKYTIKN